MCMVDYSDGCSIVLHDRNQKARKEHKCSECSRVIQVGETYNVQRAVFDGCADSYKTCAHCQVVQSWLQKECGGYMYHGVHEDIDQHRNEGYGFGVTRLSAGISGRMEAQRRQIIPNSSNSLKSGEHHHGH